MYIDAHLCSLKYINYSFEGPYQFPEIDAGSTSHSIKQHASHIEEEIGKPQIGTLLHI